MRKLLLTALSVFYVIMAFGQNDIKVEAPNVVAADEQFNVTFIIEGEENPSDFQWNPGSDFQVLWGPQSGRSTSIQIVTGKRSKYIVRISGEPVSHPCLVAAPAFHAKEKRRQHGEIYDREKRIIEKPFHRHFNPSTLCV